MCHKNLGPIWKVNCICEMKIYFPEAAESALLDEQQLWSKQKRGNQSDYCQKRSLLKLRANKRRAAEKDHILTLCAIGSTATEYVGLSVTANTFNSPADGLNYGRLEDEPD